MELTTYNSNPFEPSSAIKYNLLLNNWKESQNSSVNYISTFTPLSPGDVIVSGTPGGVGDRRDPPIYMKDGDIVEVEITRDTPGNLIFNLEGILQASVVQECVLCLGFVTTNIRESLSARFAPQDQSRLKEDEFMHTDPDHPEVYSGALLEIGKLVQDQLSLAIEPYPRHNQFGEGKRCGLKRHVENEPIGPNRRAFANLDNLLNMRGKNENS